MRALGYLDANTYFDIAPVPMLVWEPPTDGNSYSAKRQASVTSVNATDKRRRVE